MARMNSPKAAASFLQSGAPGNKVRTAARSLTVFSGFFQSMAGSPCTILASCLNVSEIIFGNRIKGNVGLERCSCLE